ncbi:hypothetical protein [Natrinema sp. 1APR25-10V2]|uniref:hypothetical protein n=1 Tax=Natrinema sp. 1APR25-10V2 TaxID=2951081 RepID=UPI002876F6FD|nr:hypothetical protein [Natrinema sp. 1APR25-10V2]MDS0477918.1 hypothetical protein [Natrinema sp. 1APR25-10V2]
MTRSTTKADDETGISTHSEPKYSDLEIPLTDPAELSWPQRRADLLDEIYARGHPSLINQTEMAERYDVNQSTISRDLDALADHIDETLGDRRDLVTESVYRRSITGLLEEEEWKDAVSAVESWNEFLDSRRDLKRLEERVAELERMEGRR